MFTPTMFSRGRPKHSRSDIANNNNNNSSSSSNNDSNSMSIISISITLLLYSFSPKHSRSGESKQFTYNQGWTSLPEAIPTRTQKDSVALSKTQ